MGNQFKENYKYLFNGNVDDDEKLEFNQRIRKVIKNSVLNIGLIGLKECVLTLEADESKHYELLLSILKKANQKCHDFSEETKLTFTLFEPSDYKSRRNLLSIDKAMYGVKDYMKEQHYYDLIFNLKNIKNDFSKIGNIQKLLNGGQLLMINLPNNVTNKKIFDLIIELQQKEIGFVRIKVGDSK